MGIFLVSLLIATTAQAHVGSMEEGDSSFENPHVILDPINSQSIFSYLDAGETDVFEFELEPLMIPVMQPVCIDPLTGAPADCGTEGAVEVGEMPVIDYSTNPPTLVTQPIMIPLQYPLLDENGNIVMDFTQTPPKPVMITATNEWGAPVMWPMAKALSEATRPFSPLAMPAACTRFKNNFFLSVAVLGPGMPPAPAVLPFSQEHAPAAPEGVWVKYAEVGERSLFTTGAEEMNEAITRMNNEDGCSIPLMEESTNLTSLMPVGLRQDCLMCGPSAGCDMNALTAFFPAYAGTYQIVVFNDENSRPGEYSLATGEHENFTCEQMQQTRDLMEAAVLGDLFVGGCKSLGESDFDGCGR
jgi:hypothetical protein